MRKLRTREVKQLVQGHAASKQGARSHPCALGAPAPRAESAVNKRGLQDRTHCGLLPGPFGPETPGLGVGSGEAPAPFTRLHLPWVWSVAGVTLGGTSSAHTGGGPPLQASPRKAGAFPGAFYSARSSLPALTDPSPLAVLAGGREVEAWPWIWVIPRCPPGRSGTVRIRAGSLTPPSLSDLETSRGASSAGVQHAFLPVT